MERTARELLGQIRSDHDVIRDLVRTGALDAIPAVLSEREQRIGRLREILAHHAGLQASLGDVLEAVRQEDRELLAWMTQQKEEIATAISSMRLESSDPYQEKFVGSAVLDQRS